MLEDLIEKYTAKADKPVHFSLHLESEWVYADEEFLKEAIGNLVDNSIKYSGEEVDIQIMNVLLMTVFPVEFSLRLPVERTALPIIYM